LVVALRRGALLVLAVPTPLLIAFSLLHQGPPLECRWNQAFRGQRCQWSGVPRMRQFRTPGGRLPAPTRFSAHR
jgi:hypothetical protein